jgi:hypothetical protein
MGFGHRTTVMEPKDPSISLLRYRQGVLHLGGSTHRPWRLTTQPTDPEAKWVVVYSLGDGADKGIYYDADPTEHIGHHLTMSRVDMVEVDQQAGGEHERQMQDDEAQNQTSPRKCTERVVWMLKILLTRPGNSPMQSTSALDGGCCVKVLAGRRCRAQDGSAESSRWRRPFGARRQASAGVAVWRQSLTRLWVAVIRRHSERQAALPRRWKRSQRRLNLV